MKKKNREQVPSSPQEDHKPHASGQSLKEWKAELVTKLGPHFNGMFVHPLTQGEEHVQSSRVRAKAKKVSKRPKSDSTARRRTTLLESVGIALQ